MKNLIFILAGVIYFSYYLFWNGDSLLAKFSEYVSYGTLLLSYINAIFAFFTAIGVIGLLNKYLDIFLKKIFSKTKNELDDIVGELIVRFINISKYVAGGYAAFYLAQTPKSLDFIVDKISSIIILIIFLVFLTSFVNTVFHQQLIFKSKLKAVSKNLLPFIHKIVIVFIWIVGAIAIIGNLGYDVSALVAGAGIGGLAVALAAQKSITNVFGAITILLNKPFKIGDFVNINGHMGTVKDIGLSYLTITDTAGHQVMIPNENIITTSIENYSVRESRRTDFSIGLVYGTSLEKMKQGVKIIEDILEKYKVNDTIKSYRVNFDMFGDFSLNINATYFSLLNKDYVGYLKQKEEINLTIKEEFEKAGLNMAFPTQELILKKED